SGSSLARASFTSCSHSSASGTVEAATGTRGRGDAATAPGVGAEGTGPFGGSADLGAVGTADAGPVAASPTPRFPVSFAGGISTTTTDFTPGGSSDGGRRCV